MCRFSKNSWNFTIGKQLFFWTHTKQSFVISTNLYLNLDPIRMKFCLDPLSFTGPFSRKNEWCSMAHFHRCLQARSLGIRNTKVCSCSRPCRIKVPKDEKLILRIWKSNDMKSILLGYCWLWFKLEANHGLIQADYHCEPAITRAYWD